MRVLVDMAQEVAAVVLPPELRARLEELTTLTTSLTDAELLLSGWGHTLVLDRPTLAGAPALRAVVHTGGSVKGLVTNATWERGLLVSTAAGINAGPVADYTVAVILLAAKKALSAALGGWPEFAARQGTDGTVIGVVGASRVGRKVIARLLAAESGYRLLLYDPYVPAAEAEQLGVHLLDLDSLCRQCRVLTLHAPELPATRGLLSARRLALLPDGATVINTARGSLIDTEALARECASGRLDAFLDVTDPEPLPPGHPLLGLPNVLLTPHIAGAQGSEARRLGLFAVREVERLARGERLRGLVQWKEMHRMA
ncbi:hydroxyacid dehydrogenase [Streptomyces orinoci]|uniref:Hydroxyacid dehydrogenase n=1 Tax=Streptomyces orinoci TaxID=67339 RepID=A0ABV3JTE5_STRON|nr:hydroxyacid dehydrogenase [Streptomyces orinoci]